MKSIFLYIFILNVLMINSLHFQSFNIGRLKKNRSLKPLLKLYNRLSNTLTDVNSPLFTFGIIADIQYVDSPDAMNFQGTKLRRYRQSLDIFRKAINYWNNLSNDRIKCAVVLGDMIDGKCNSLNQSDTTKDLLLNICKESNNDVHFCFGNHCHYNYNRYDLYSHFIDSKYDKLSPYISQHDNQYIYPLHYYYIPHPGWRFIFLDSYDISLIGYSNILQKFEAEKQLSIHNPNDLSISGTWFNNLPEHKQRWVPYNGGIGAEQYNWLSNQLDYANINNEKVIIFSHQPVYAPSNPKSLIWNAEEILNLCHEKGNVIMWLAGHDHDGSYTIDSKGIHHLIPPAPIECPDGEVAYGSIKVYDNKLSLEWIGKVPENTVHPWPNQLLI